MLFYRLGHSCELTSCGQSASDLLHHWRTEDEVCSLLSSGKLLCVLGQDALGQVIIYILIYGQSSSIL